MPFFVKHGLVVNKEYNYDDFNIITDNEALAIDLDFPITKTSLWQPFTAQMEILNLTLLQIVNNLSENVMFLRDFSSKLESFGSAKKNTSGPLLRNIQKQLNLMYLINDEHTYMDRTSGSADLLYVAFISPNLAKHDIQFQIGDDLGSNHLPIKVSIDAPPHSNSSINHARYKFVQTPRAVFKSMLEAALGSTVFS